MSVVHDHNTGSKKQLSFGDALEKIEGNILEQISNLNHSLQRCQTPPPHLLTTPPHTHTHTHTHTPLLVTHWLHVSVFL